MKIEVLQQEINSCLTKIGLHKLMYDFKIEEALNLTQDKLKSMSAEECGILAYTLKQYALYIQVECNKYKNIMEWSQRNISILLAKEYNNLGDKYTKYQVKRKLLITTNSFAEDLYRKYIDAKIQFNTMFSVSKNVSFIAETLLSLQQTKRYNK